METAVKRRAQAPDLTSDCPIGQQVWLRRDGRQRHEVVTYMGQARDGEAIVFFHENVAGAHDILDIDFSTCAYRYLYNQPHMDVAGPQNSVNEEVPGNAGEKITDAMLHAAVRHDDIDDAMKSVMDQVGITTGDVAAYALEEYRGMWRTASTNQRVIWLYHWRDQEIITAMNYSEHPTTPDVMSTIDPDLLRDGADLTLALQTYLAGQMPQLPTQAHRLLADDILDLVLRSKVARPELQAAYLSMPDAS